MEVPWHNLFPDMEMEDDGEFFNQRQSNSFDDEEVLVLGDILLHPAAFSSESGSLSPQTQNNSATTTTATAIAAEGAGSGTLSFDDNNNNRKRCKILSKSNSSNSIASQLVPEKPATSSQKSYILSFHASNVGAGAASREGGGGRKRQGGGGSTRCSSRGANQTHQSGKKGGNSSESLDHIMAERRRRQELTERFIALSATIPGLKKIDKASILGEAINYVKQLQERVKKLEDQSSKQIKVDSLSLTNKADLYSEEGTASSKTNFDEYHRLNVALPEVEARALEKQVLIRIHCKKQSDEMLKILTHLKSLDLSTVSSSVLPFGNSTLDITIIAQMGGKYNATVKDLVKSLRLSLLESPDVQQ